MRLLNVVFLLCLAAPCGSAGVVLSINPAVASVLSGSDVTLSVDISGVSDLYAWQFDLTFDPAILQVQSQTEGDFLSSAGPTFFISGFLDTGSITNIADALEGSGPGADGSGTLLNLNLLGLGIGTSALSVSNVFLLDSLGNDIPFTSSDSAITITPEPESLWLVVPGAPLAWWRNRKLSVDDGK